MRVISKKITHNSLESKIPGIIPSIMDSWVIPGLYDCREEEVFYSYDLAVRRASEYNIKESQLEYRPQFANFDKNTVIEFSSGNYGLIPSDVIIPNKIADKITDYTDIYVNIPDDDGGFYDLSWPKNEEDPHYEGRKIISGGTEIKILTYYTLNKWYSFFKKYYGLINDSNNVRKYENAIDYYNKEIVVKNSEQFAYYNSLDETFEARGGEDMYNWITSNCILQYQIPPEFTDKWNATFLYYSDAIKWYYWFKKRNEIYEKIDTIEGCKDVDPESGSCCDCTEFFNLGGKEFYEGLKEWVDGIDINPTFATNSASITIPISITTSIDDLGEMAIFSNKWVEEQDYHNTLNTTGYGTVMDRPYTKYFKCKSCGYEAPETLFVNGKCPKCQCDEYDVIDATFYETYMIKSGDNRKGYEYNKYYENSFKTDDWVNYTDYYISENPSEFVISGVANNEVEEISAYTFSPVNGKIIYNPVEITEVIDANIIRNVCINGNTYDIINGKYVELCYDSESFADLKYKKKKKLQILKDGDIQYTIYNGKKKYVEVDSDGKEKIYFLKESNCKDEGCELSGETEYIIYDGCLYLVKSNKITIEDDTKYIYPVLDGYFDLFGNRFYISGTSVVIQDSADYSDSDNSYTYKFREVNEGDLVLYGIEKIEISGDNVILYYIFDKINCNIISGYTDSKLDVLRRKEVTTDDLGNELPGYFRSIVNIDKGKSQSKYNLPYDECTLDILYKVGEVSNLKSISLDNTRFVGDIITDIKFYYRDDSGNTKIEYHALNDDALDAIKKCEDDYEEYLNKRYENEIEGESSSEESEFTGDENIIGVMYCDITYYLGGSIKKVGKKYELDDTVHTGVMYIDTVYVNKRIGTYYINDDSTFTYIYYMLSQDVNTIDLTDFNASITWDCSTYFEMMPLLYTSSGIKDSEEFAEFEHNNGTISAPLFRNEFNLASSLPQNVEADIYIDRGISAAFEKHLKLQEIRTMEALENYGNSWFKINEY